jgi:hypothetical protein
MGGSDANHHTQQMNVINESGMIKLYKIHRKGGLFKMKDFNTTYKYSGVQTYITVKGKETFRLLLHIPDRRSK